MRGCVKCVLDKRYDRHLWCCEMIGQISRIYSYRFFIISSIRNEFKTKFSRSKLGGLWMIINPVVQAVVYATVLSSIIASRLPGIDSKYAYALYLLAGMSAWALFYEVLMGCVNVFVDKADLMKKVSFPRVCLPVVSGGVALVNNGFLLLAILVVFIFLGNTFSASLLIFPFVIFINFIFALSLGTILGIFNVVIRDVGQAVQIVLQALFWLTPIVYTPDILPQSIKGVLLANPVYKIVGAYHDVLVFGEFPDLWSIFQLSVLAFALALLAILLFRRAASDISDAL